MVIRSEKDMENYYRIFDKMPLACLVLEPGEAGYLIKKVNKAYLELASIDSADLIGFSFEEILNGSKCRLRILAALNESVEFEKETFLDCLENDLFEQKDLESKERFWSIKFTPVLQENEVQSSEILCTFFEKTQEVFANREFEFISKKLIEKTEVWEKFIDQNADALYSLDSQGNFSYVNKAVVTILGMPQNELLNTSFFRFCADGDRARIWSHFQESLAGHDQDFQADFITSNGEKLMLCISFSPFKTASGLKVIYGRAKDIRESLLAETEVEVYRENLYKNERKFKALIQGATDLVGIVDEEATYKFVSDSVYPILGMRPADFIGNKAFDFIHPEDIDCVLQDFNQILEKAQVTLRPFRFRDGEGNWKWVESRVTNMLNDPDIQGLVVNSREMTELMLKRKEIKYLYDRYRLLSKVTKDIMYDWDILENTVVRSSSFVKNFGTEKFALTGEAGYWLGRVVENKRAYILEKLQESLADPKVNKWYAEYSVLNMNNKQIHVVDHAFIVRDKNGEAIRLVGAIRNITKPKELLERIKKQNESLKDLAWDQAHLLRAPVARILALVNHLENESYLEWSKTELLKYIKDSANELDNIITARLERSRIKI